MVHSLLLHVVVQKVAVELPAEVLGWSVPQVITQLPNAGDLSETLVCNELQSNWLADSAVQRVL